MVDEAVRGPEIQDEELALEAPEQGSAEELLDAHAGDQLDPMRHSAAHVMAEAVMDLFPGTKLGIGPAIKDGFYYDFELPRAADARGSGEDRSADGRVGRGRPQVRSARSCRRRRGGLLRRA